MFSTCSKLTPRAPIPDGRRERIMQPWAKQPLWQCGHYLLCVLVSISSTGLQKPLYPFPRGKICVQIKAWHLGTWVIEFTNAMSPTGLHKLWYPGIRDRSTWSKFGAHGEHGDVFLGSPTSSWITPSSDTSSFHTFSFLHPAFSFNQLSYF